MSARSGSAQHAKSAYDIGREAVDALFPVVYQELRGLARHQLRRMRPGDTLGTTALVNEAYLRLAAGERPGYRDRKHFFCVAAMAMRQIVVDYARHRAALKRGGAAAHVLLREHDGAHLAVESQAAALVALDAALTELAGSDERLLRVVELRFFSGLSVDETAALLGLSTATIKRDTRVARAFLVRAMEDPADA